MLLGSLRCKNTLKILYSLLFPSFILQEFIRIYEDDLKSYPKIGELVQKLCGLVDPPEAILNHEAHLIRLDGSAEDFVLQHNVNTILTVARTREEMEMIFAESSGILRIYLCFH